jgi:hypothetical protein
VVAEGCELAKQETIMKKVASRSAEVLLIGFLLDSFFDPEYGGSMFLRKAN